MRSTKIRFGLASMAVLTTAIVMAFGPWASAENLGTTSTPEAGAGRSANPGHEVVVYYFHGTQRCNTCRTIESDARAAVKARFADELERGELQFKVINTDEPDNAHFLEDFGLVSSSLVVAEIDGDEVLRHDVLQDVWTLVRDKPHFNQYVQSSVEEYLK